MIERRTIMVDLNRLIEFYKYPVETVPYYHTDVVDDTVTALEELRELKTIIDMLFDRIYTYEYKSNDAVELSDIVFDAIQGRGHNV